MCAKVKSSGILSVLILALMVTACAVSASSEQSSRAAASPEVSPCEPVRVRAGVEFEIRVTGNASTGCSWQVTDLDWNVVELLGVDYEEATDRDQMLGAGGEATVRFRALGPGHTSIKLVFGHSWELDTATYLIKTLDVTVE